MSNVGSEQTFENLVDKLLDQLKKKKAWLLNALVLSIIILYWIYFLLKYVVFKIFFLTVLCNFFRVGRWECRLYVTVQLTCISSILYYLSSFMLCMYHNQPIAYEKHVR